MVETEISHHKIMMYQEILRELTLKLPPPFTE